MLDAGRYRLVRRIGRGGMAEIFEAVAAGDAGFERRVALKRLLPAHSGDTSFHRMFVDEARIASQLHHANVVAVLDFGVVDGVPFQVMEFVEGIHAGEMAERSKLAGSPLPPEVALFVCAEVARGLAHAHGARDLSGRRLGIVHRDVSPSNVLVSWDGDVKLADFGIAFALGRMERTEAGTTKGKLLYMAPEQATGGEIDGRTDLFALGCVLHKLLAGRSPLEGADRFMALLSGGEPELDRSLPPDVLEIAAAAVRRSKHERFETATAMAQALDRAVAARIGRDPRAAMRDFLAKLRPGEPAPERQGRLDGLLEVDLVLGGVATGVRTFVTTPAGGPTVPLAIAPERSLRVEPRTEEVSFAGPRRAGRRGARVAAGVAVVAVVALAVWLAGGRWYGRAESEPPGQSSAVPSHAPAAEPVSKERPAPALATAPRTIPPAAAAPAAPPPVAEAGAPSPPVVGTGEDAGARDAGRRDAAGGGAGPPRDSGSPPGGAADAGQDRSGPGPAVPMGAVAVGGEGALRAEILADGLSRGFAPKQFELAVGAHTLEIVTPDGRRIGRGTVEITQRHTPIAPFRWTVPAEP